jgi:hypothetical protein
MVTTEAKTLHFQVRRSVSKALYYIAQVFSKLCLLALLQAKNHKFCDIAIIGRATLTGG